MKKTFKFKDLRSNAIFFLNKQLRKKAIEYTLLNPNCKDFSFNKILEHPFRASFAFNKTKEGEDFWYRMDDTLSSGIYKIKVPINEDNI